MSQSTENFVPEWAKNAVWYQIFPDRFRNGDLSNDPQLKDIKGSYPHDNTSPWEIHPCGSDWYKMQEWEKETGKDIWFNLQRRRYGGDLAGIIKKLDYLKELGINAIYLNPVFQSPSLHKYDGSTYHHIDPNFGPDPEGDLKLIASEKFNDPSTWVWTSADKLFLELIREVHKRDMRIIIDGVFNHMGLNSPAFIDVQKNQEKSEYADWFKINSFRNEEKGTDFNYSGWFGVKELPELNQDENGITPSPKKYIFDITRRWMDPEGNGDISKGIDGWRLDVAYMVKHNFWKDWRKHVKSINPEAYITAEIIEPVEYNKPYLAGDEFDAVMNYNFAFACEEFFINEKDNTISPSQFDEKLKTLREAYPECVSYVQQNLFDSHDTNRLLSHIKNKNIGHYREWGTYFPASQASNPEYDVSAPGKYDITIMKLMVLFQMTYVGAPMIYYGDEIGMWGANDPCCRKPMIWDDIEYEPEQYNPDQSLRDTADKVAPDLQLYKYYRNLIFVRNSFPAFRTGKYKTVVTDDENNIFAFERYDDNSKFLVIINNSDKTQKFTPDIPAGKYKEYLNKSIIKINGEITLVPKSGLILQKQD